MAAVTIDGTIIKVKMIEEDCWDYGRSMGRSGSITRQAITFVDDEARRFWGKLPASAPTVAFGDVVRVRCSVSAEKDTVTFVNRIKILVLIDEENTK